MDKLEKFLLLLDHPSDFTEEEAKDILADDEAISAYNALRKMKEAQAPHSVGESVDVEGEWRNFENKLSARRDKSVFRRFSRQIAASVIVVLAISAVATGLVMKSSESRVRSESENAELTLEKGSVSGSENRPASVDDQDVSLDKENGEKTFENENLATILNTIASSSGLTVLFENEDVKSLRLYYVWNSSQPIEETVDQLNSFDSFSLALCDSVLVVN